MQIQRLKGAFEVMKHMTDEGDTEGKKKLESIEEELQDKEEELEGLGSMNQALIIKERKTNDELQEARKQLIYVSFLLLCLATKQYSLDSSFFFLIFC